MEEIGQRPSLECASSALSARTPTVVPRVPRFDDDDLEEVGATAGVQRIVVTMGDRRGKLQVEKLLRLKTSGVYIQDGPEYYESITGRIPLDSLRLSWLLFSPGFHVRAALRLYKRLFSLHSGWPRHSADVAAHAAGRYCHPPGLEGPGHLPPEACWRTWEAVHGVQVPLDVRRARTRRN